MRNAQVFEGRDGLIERMTAAARARISEYMLLLAAGKGVHD
jgi:hypothetical protein